LAADYNLMTTDDIGLLYPWIHVHL